MGRLAIVFDKLDTDVETVARAAAASRDVVLVSDVRSPSVELLQRELSAELLVAVHRMIDTGHGLGPSDADLAARLARSHVVSPLDAIVYAGDAIVDLSWHEPALRSIPRGRLLNGRLAAIQKTLGNTRDYVEFGPTVVALAGEAATSDFVVTCQGSFGLPPWLGVRHFSSEDSVWLARQGTVVDVRGLDQGETIVEVRETAKRQPGLITAIGTSPEQGTAIQAFLPSSIAGRVIYCNSADPWAGELVGDGGQAPSASLADALRDASFQNRTLPGSRVVVGAGMTQLRRVLDELLAEGSDEVIIAVADDPALADGFVGSGALHADLAFAAASRKPMGDLDPHRLRGDVVAIGERGRHAARMAAEQSPDFTTLIHRLTEPSLTASAVVGLVPGHEIEHPQTLRTMRTPEDLGLRITPPLLPVPNAPAEPHPPPKESIDAKTWVGQLKWGTRSRLALPWRWNLLPRAMRGRW